MPAKPHFTVLSDGYRDHDTIKKSKQLCRYRHNKPEYQISARAAVYVNVEPLLCNLKTRIS